jgi:hypothetical protein
MLYTTVTISVEYLYAKDLRQFLCSLTLRTFEAVFLFQEDSILKNFFYSRKRPLQQHVDHANEANVSRKS